MEVLSTRLNNVPRDTIIKFGNVNLTKETDITRPPEHPLPQ